MDYRGLNASTINNKYPLFIFGEVVEHLSGVAIPKIKLRIGYNPVRIKDGDIEDRTFHSHFDHNEYLSMSFRFTNTPSTYIYDVALMYKT